MRMLVENLLDEPFSLDLGPLAAGDSLREYIEVGETLEVPDIDPYDINTFELARVINQIGQVSITFVADDNDLIGLPFDVTTFPWKVVTRASTVADITLSGLQTVDGVALADGDRVLVKDQAAPAENGIYVVRAGAWERAGDANTSDRLPPGSAVFVSEGTSNANNGYVLETNAPITIDTTALTFSEFTGGAGGGESNTGANVGTGTGEVFRDKTGTTLNFKRLAAGTGIGIVNDADEITISSTVAAPKLLQTQRAELAVDAATTVTSPTYSTLLSVPITTTTGNVVAVRASLSGDSSKNNTEGSFRVRVDGTPSAGAYWTSGPTRGNSAACITYVPVTAGAHTVDVQWTRTAGGGTRTLFVSAATLPDEQHATLEVQELTTP